MPCGRKRKRHKIATHKRKKRLRKNKHKKKNDKEKNKDKMKEIRVNKKTINVASGIEIKPAAIGRCFFKGCFLS
jgi:hypothetical protein